MLRLAWALRSTAMWIEYFTLHTESKSDSSEILRIPFKCDAIIDFLVSMLQHVDQPPPTVI